MGEIVNLMAIDVERLAQTPTLSQNIWACPYQISLALVFLFRILGLAAAPGVLVIVLFVPLNVLGSVFIKKWQVEQMKLKDERTKMCNEVLNGIKVANVCLKAIFLGHQALRLGGAHAGAHREASSEGAEAPEASRFCPQCLGLLQHDQPLSCESPVPT